MACLQLSIAPNVTEYSWVRFRAGERVCSVAPSPDCCVCWIFEVVPGRCSARSPGQNAKVSLSVRPTIEHLRLIYVCSEQR